WKMIAAHIGTKTEEEVKEYARMYLSQLRKERELKKKKQQQRGNMTQVQVPKRKKAIMGKFARSDSLSKVPSVDEDTLEVTEDTWSYDEVRTTTTTATTTTTTLYTYPHRNACSKKDWHIRLYHVLISHRK
ncbi:MAG: SANT/Myb-like DNA-binding domain-containing protein, partial [Candidatus Thermoplasmatota archaeon]|nr:SANT/Myb-like DNA-binding domain-containing protein [Candidatus Thermoplasmatota archaeon]